MIVCAGAIESPHLLMVSGIGATQNLRPYGIQVQAELPGVGENFHNHVLTGVIREGKQQVPTGKQNLSEVALFCKSNPAWPAPDLQIAFVHVPFDITDYLNGEIVRIAHRHGTAAPVNAGLATLMRKAVREGAGPGAYSAAALALNPLAQQNDYEFSTPSPAPRCRRATYGVGTVVAVPQHQRRGVPLASSAAGRVHTLRSRC